jgi:hypothetical protein
MTVGRAEVCDALVGQEKEARGFQKGIAFPQLRIKPVTHTKILKFSLHANSIDVRPHINHQFKVSDNGHEQ